MRNKIVLGLNLSLWGVIHLLGIRLSLKHVELTSIILHYARPD